MNSSGEDRILLERYVEAGCEESFTALVAKHLNHVYSVAWRETRDPHLAEELTQATFVILARKAGQLPRGAVLAGWLFTTVRYAARNARRAQARRKQQEAALATMSPEDLSPDHETLWQQVSPVLNEALAALNALDRDAVLLRFFEQRSHAEIAAALNTTEPAARKRLSRALERLRSSLLRRGVAVPPLVLAGLLSARGLEAAPVTLGASGVAAAATNTAAGSLSPVAESTLRGLALAKVKTAVLAGALLLAGAGVAVKTFTPAAPATPNSYTLADGSFLSLTGTELAEQATFRFTPRESFPQRLLRRLLPSSLSRRWLPASGGGRISIGSQDGHERLFVAAAHENRPNNPIINLERVQVASDDGSVSDGMFDSGTLSYPGSDLKVWGLHAFPRRGTNLLLRFFHLGPLGTWVRAAELSLTNPVIGPHPQWTTEPLPINRTSGDLAVRLVRFETEAVGVKPRPLTATFWEKYPTTRWALELSAAPGSATPWAVRSIDLADATGNRWSANEVECWLEPTQPPRLHAKILGALWASELAWDVRFELSRTNAYQPEELFSLANVQLPATGELSDLTETRRIGRARAEFVAIGGRRCPLPGPFRWATDLEKVNLGLEMKGDWEGKRLSLVRVSDDRNRPLRFEDTHPPYHQKHFVFSVAPEPDAQSLTFVFALHSSRFVQFRARPTPP